MVPNSGKQEYGSIVVNDDSLSTETPEESPSGGLKLPNLRFWGLVGTFCYVAVLLGGMVAKLTGGGSLLDYNPQEVAMDLLNDIDTCPSEYSCGTGTVWMHLHFGENCHESCVPEAQVPSRSASGYTCGNCAEADSVDLDGKTGTLSDITSKVTTTSSAGSGQSIANMQPFGTVNYIIATQGVYPSRSRRLSSIKEHRNLQSGESFIGEILMFGGTFAPRGYELCDGQLLPISSNTALFSLLGTIYGGDGRTTFALPDLRGRSPVGAGTGLGLSRRSLGERFGTEEVTMSTFTLPSHSHTVDLSNFSPLQGVLTGTDSTADDKTYSLTDIAGPSVTSSSAGGDESLDNSQPSSGINYVIALDGIFPSRNRRLQVQGSKHRRLGYDPFLGEISMVGFNFAPRGWALCQGQLLDISSNTALFSILGTTYGGDGRSTFGLPDLRGRVAIGFSSPYPLGSLSGTQNKPTAVFRHTHTVAASDLSPLTGALSGTDTVVDQTTASFNSITGPSVTSASSGISESSNNMQPFLSTNYIIALEGTFPSRNRRLEEQDAESKEDETGQGHRRLDAYPMIGQIELFGGSFAPRGWAFCQGQLLTIDSNTALFSLLGTIYGGDGRETFALPNLEGRSALHAGSGPGLSQRSLGQTGGSQTTSPNVVNLVSHTHSVDSSNFAPLNFKFNNV